MIYNIRFDSNGYVLDATALPTALPEYHPCEINQQVSADYLRGYHKLINGQFVFDQAKYHEWLLAQQPEEPTDE